MLDAPSYGLTDSLAAQLAELSPQFVEINAAEPFGQWICIVALAEQLGTLDLAQLTLDELILWASQQPKDASVGAPEELEALCWARRGRVARARGHHDDADAHYRHAIRHTRGAPWRDARPQAELGLAVLAYARGNFPDVAARARSIVRRRLAVQPLYRAQAYQLLSFVSRRQGQLLDALLFGWEAYGLLESFDVLRAEIVVVLSETAFAYGDFAAAMTGFRSVVRTGLPSRLAVPAWIGVMDAALAMAAREDVDVRTEASADVREAVRALESIPPTLLAVGDQVLRATALASTATALRDEGSARRWITVASELAERHGFHEKRFQLEGLAKTVDSWRIIERHIPALAGAASQPPSAPDSQFASVGVESEMQRALARFAKLGASAADAVMDSSRSAVAVGASSARRKGAQAP